MKTLSNAFLSIICVCGAPALGQLPQGPAGQNETVPIYRITVVGRTIKAVNYGSRHQPTKIDFRGTVLEPEARGEARVENRRGSTVVDAKFERLRLPAKFGAQYLTYVLWAITPEGRAINLGEVVLDPSDKGKLHVTTDLQAFGLLVTAEPYYSVTQPSDVVVMENMLRSNTDGKVEAVDAKYELLPRGHYTYEKPGALEAAGQKLSMDRYEAVLQLYQARNAVQIARAEGVDRYASDTMRKAEQLLQEAEAYQAQQMRPKEIIMVAREAAQVAEDARSIAAKRQEEERQINQRQARAERVPR